MNEQKSIYGLVGYPLGHSLSPLMHNAAFDALEVDATYQLFPLKEEEFSVFLGELKKPDSPIFGLNVTVPYKEKVIPYLDNLNPYAQKVKAVNTIVIGKNRRLTGYNTDGPGFLAHITELGFNPQSKRISILGAGGAARAILSVFCMIEQAPQWIKIYDVDYDKAKMLVSDLSQNLNCEKVEVCQSIDDLNIELSDLLINATPIGLKDSDEVLIEPDLLHSDMLVYDLIYNPDQTKFLKMAKEKGAKTSNGLGMLFYQGVLAFQHWAEIDLPEVVRSKMKNALQQGVK
ncbi:MAG: shikimate dehydrogenase [Candidatus Omnitrophica bacterium]|nr:shikimate dehydrogenase [Candidatus Omnitrophota bacterium]